MKTKWEREKPFIFRGNTKPKPKDPNYLSISELARYLRVYNLTIKRWDMAGKIKSIRVGKRGDRYFSKEEIKKILGIYDKILPE